MKQRLGPAHVGDDTYRIVEATMMNQAKRITGWDWYQAAWHTGTTIPSRMEMRNYGRECALAYVLEGDDITVAVTKATKHVYQRTYDDARGVIRHVGGSRDRAEAVTSLADTQTTLLNEGDQTNRTDKGFYHHTQYVDNHRWFEIVDAIARLDATPVEKKTLVYLAAGYTKKETADALGLKPTTLHMRIPKLAERIGKAWLTGTNSNQET